MTVDRFKVWSAVAALALLASAVSENQARADDLQLGGNYNAFSWTLNTGSFSASNEGGGSISPSYLNGVALPWVYCIDIPDNVDVPGDYSHTTVTTNGTAWFGSHNPWTGGTAGVYTAGGSATIAGQIAWILDHYANSASTPAEQEAVQAAIWKVEYGSAFTVQDSGVNTAMNAILTALGSNTDAVSNIFWLSPNGSGEQALVTAAVPEPSTFAIAGVALSASWATAGSGVSTPESGFRRLIVTSSEARIVFFLRPSAILIR